MAEKNDPTLRQYKGLARLLPARSLNLNAANVHRSGVKMLSGPTKGATEATTLFPLAPLLCRALSDNHIREACECE